MSVSFGDVQTAIRDGIVALGVVPDRAVAWEFEQQPTAKTKVILSLLYATAIQDRDTYTEDPDLPGSFQWGLSSLFYIRVQIRVESVYNAPGADAMVALEQIRAGLRRPGLTWNAGVVYQPDIQTYVHRTSFQFDGRTINSHAIELGFRAVVDFPLTGPEDGEPNMTEVQVLESEVDVGETDPLEYEATVTRP